MLSCKSHSVVVHTGLNGSTRVGNVGSSSNIPQNSSSFGQAHSATGQSANIGFFSRQRTPNAATNLGSSRASSANYVPNHTVMNQRELVPRAQLVSAAMQSGTNIPDASQNGMANSIGSAVSGIRQNQAVGQSLRWQGIGNFQQTPQAGGPTGSNSPSHAFLQQTRQPNIGVRQIPQQLSQQILLQTQTIQQQTQSFGTNQRQAPEQLSQRMLLQAHNIQKQNQSIGTNSQIPVPRQLSQQILLPAQNLQNQNLISQQQQLAQARGQVNLAQAIGFQRMQLNQTMSTVSTPNAQQNRNTLNQQQLQQQLPGWLQGNLFPSNGMR